MWASNASPCGWTTVNAEQGGLVLAEVADALLRSLPALPCGGYALRAGLIAFLPGYRPGADWRRQTIRLKRRWWQVFSVKRHKVVIWVADGVLRRVFIDGRVAHRSAPRSPAEKETS